MNLKLVYFFKKSAKYLESCVDTRSMMNIELLPEILINASLVTDNQEEDSYEFVLNQSLNVVECVQVESSYKGTIKVIPNPAFTLDGMLFELNHVRVNPRADNTLIIKKLTNELNNIGVSVSNLQSTPVNECFKPLGEISDNVRFYLNHHSKLIFLSPARGHRLVL